MVRTRHGGVAHWLVIVVIRADCGEVADQALAAVWVVQSAEIATAAGVTAVVPSTSVNALPHVTWIELSSLITAVAAWPAIGASSRANRVNSRIHMVPSSG